MCVVYMSPRAYLVAWLLGIGISNDDPKGRKEKIPVVNMLSTATHDDSWMG